MMHRDANQIMKSDLNWSDISFEKAAQYGYSAEMVKAQRLEEIRVRKLITDAIAEMIKEYGKKLAEKLARERQQGTPIQTLLPPPPPPEDDTP